MAAMRPGDDFDERRFAGAVLPEQRVDFASAQIKGNPLECANGLKRLCNLAKLEERRGSWHLVEIVCRLEFVLSVGGP